MDEPVAQYAFRTVNQSVSYTLSSKEVTFRYRKGLTSSSQTFPLDVFDGRSSSWDTTNVAWVGMAIVSVLAIVFGVWGLIDPKATGMHAVVATGLILVGSLLPVVLWQHRRLSGVTFTGEHGYALSIIAHAVQTTGFHNFVDALKSHVRSERD